MHKKAIKQYFYICLIFVFTSACVNKSKLESCTIVPMASVNPPSYLEDAIQQDSIIGHSVNVVFVKDDYTYLGVGAWFIILDISDISNPRLVNSMNLFVDSITVIGEYAHVSGEELHIFDISDPVNLKEVRCQENAPINLANATIAGNYAYVPEWDKGLRIIDVSDPVMLFEIGVYQEQTAPKFILLPQPELIESQPRLVTDVVIIDKYAYISESLLGIDSLYDGQVRILDISNPAKPKPVGIYEMPHGVGAELLDESHNRLFVSASSFDTPSSILLDVTDPMIPVEIDASPLPRGNVAFFREYAYFATGHSGLQVWNVSDSIEPVRNWQDFHYGFTLDAVFRENYAYLGTQYNGLMIVDVSDPVNPITVSTYP